MRLVFTRGAVTRSVTTDPAGRYRIALVPGRYAVHVVGARFGFEPRVATVPQGVFRLVNFALDTGIR